MNEENIRKCSVIGPCLVMREVLTYQWECWFTPKALGEGWTRGTKWGRFCGGHGRKNYSLYSKWKLEPPRGHDWRSFLSSPLLFRLPPTTTTAAVIVQCSETGKLFGLTICVCVCVCERAPRYWTDVRSQLCSLPGLFSLHFIPPTCNKGCVTLWPHHLHEKVKYLKAKKRIMETQIFHAAKM